MKIISLRIENIASLKGSHLIEFDNILEHSGVFAITGETGSGKSTLLNCISLALYGEHYKKSNKQQDFVTLGETSGEIELIYTNQGLMYKAYWYLRLKKNDGTYLKNPEKDRQFYVYQDNNWQSIKETPQEVLNLTFDQFTKTIILNQGEFAKFLTSGFKDRKDILSKMYDGQKLDKLSVHVKRKIDDLTQKEENFKSQISGINENTNFDLDEALKIVQNHKDQKSYFQSIQAQLEKSLDFLKDLNQSKSIWIKSEETIKSLEVKLKTHTLRYNEQQKESDQEQKKLEDKKNILNQKSPLLQKCISKIEYISDQEKSIEKYNQRHKEVQQKVSEESKYIDELKENQKNYQDLILNLKKNASYTKLNEKKMHEIQDLLKTLKKEQQQLDLLSQKNKHNKRDLKELTDKADQIKKEINQTTSQQIEKEYENDKKALSTLDTQKENNEKLIYEIKSFNNQNKSLVKDKQQLEQLLKETNKKINDKSKEINKTQERLIELKRAFRSFELEEYIKELKKESLLKNECLVCHNKDLKSLTTDQSTEDNDEFQKIKEKKEQKEQRLSELELKLESLRSSQSHYRGQLINLEEKKNHQMNLLFQNHSLEKEKLQDPLKLITELEDQTDKIIKDREIKKNKLEKTQKELERNKFLNQQLESLRTEYQSKNKAYQTQQEEYDNIGQKVILQQNELNKEFEKDIDIESVEKCIEINKELNFNQNHLDLNLSNQKKSEDRKKSYNQEQKDLLKEIKSLNKHLETNKAFIKENSQGHPVKELSELEQAFQYQEQVYKDITKDLNQTKIQIAEQTSKLKNYKEQKEESDHLFKITSQQLNDLVRNNELSKEITIQSHNDYIELIKNFFIKLEKPIFIDQADIEILQETLNINQDHLKTSKSIIDQYNRSIVKDETLIDQKITADKKIKDLKKDQKKISKRKNELQDLFDLVGKDEFRNFVLSLIEKNLIQQTNYELKNLCDDRYIIKHFSKNTKSMPDFYVIDKFKGGLTRKVSTLSGGETFMVSLAMAVALAELTRGSSEIDSFFIDEGFGTLDEDSLEDVLEMIRNMEQRGKSIGLISHIKNLTNRISVNIQLEKSQLGNSTVNLHFN